MVLGGLTAADVSCVNPRCRWEQADGQGIHEAPADRGRCSLFKLNVTATVMKRQAVAARMEFLERHSVIPSSWVVLLKEGNESSARRFGNVGQH